MAWYSYIDNFETCPLNPSHRIEKGRKFQLHLIKCQMDYPQVRLIHCPYNYSHLLKHEDLEAHIARCPSLRTKNFSFLAGVRYSSHATYRPQNQQAEVSVVIYDDGQIINPDTLSGLKKSVKRKLRQEIRPGIVIERDSKDYVVKIKRPAIRLSPLRKDDYELDVDEVGSASAYTSPEYSSVKRESTIIDHKENEIICLDDSDDDYKSVCSEKVSPIDEPTEENEITVIDDSAYSRRDNTSEYSSVYETASGYDTDAKTHDVSSDVKAEASKGGACDDPVPSSTSSCSKIPDFEEYDDDILIIETEMDMMELTGDLSSTTREFSSLSLRGR